MEYPNGNPGAHPVDLASPVGQFRAMVGDLNSESYTPVEPGIQNFLRFSDAEIEGYLTQAEGSINRAVGYSYLYLAGQAAMEALAIKDYDLQVDSTKRAADLRAIAQMWFGLADTDDISSAEEGFVLVPTGTNSGGFIPELAPPIWGRQYTSSPARPSAPSNGAPDLIPDPNNPGYWTPA